MTTHADLFTSRQLTALTTFSDLVAEARKRCEADASSAPYLASRSSIYADAVATYLCLSISRLADQHNTLVRWSTSRDQSIGLFARHAIPMVWDYPEVNPFANAAGDLSASLPGLSQTIASLPASPRGTSAQRDARSMVGTGIVATDPPYYDNIGYADLSDFFYVWLRRTARAFEPALFETLLTPKRGELIASPFRHSSRIEADNYFENGFVEVFAEARKAQLRSAPLSLFYAFKQTESEGGDGTSSVGWATMLEGLMAAGWTVVATWPLRTERAARSIAINTNSLASSVVLACRPRSDSAGVTDRQGLVRALRTELPRALHELEKSSIAPVDLRQAAIGPGMAVFSRYAKVVEPDGSSMRVRIALGLINQVLDSVLSDQESDFDAETRWAINWFSQYRVAESLSVAMAVAIDGMQRSGILRSGGGKVQLLSPDDLDDVWDPTTDDRTPIWEATHHLVRRLERGGEVAAAALLADLGTVADSCRALAYRLYTICETKKPVLAGPYNALAASWTEMTRIGRGDTTVTNRDQQSLNLEDS
jgi:putative DNA methylase